MNANVLRATQRRLTRVALGLLVVVGALGSGVAAQNPVPLVSLPLVPDHALPAGAAFTLTVNGTGFVSGAQVNWNGSARATQFISSSQLTAAIEAADVAVAGTASVTITNPRPGGGTSNVVFFTISEVTASVAYASSTFSTGQAPTTVVAADFNGDGKLDLAVANLVDNSVSILLGNGDGTFQAHVDYPTSSAGAFPFTILTDDFNHDGKLDLVVGSSILLGNGDGTFQPFVTLAIAGSVDADFNGDGNLDLAALVPNETTGASTISVALGNGDGTFQAAVESATMVQVGAPGLLSVNAGDLNGDGKLDLAVTSNLMDGETSGSLFVQLGNGDGTFQPGSLVVRETFFNPLWVGLGDLNGDGKLDLAMITCFSRDLPTPEFSYPVLLGTGDGAFAVGAGGAAPAGASACPESGVLGDFNSDGRLDLVALNPPVLLFPGQPLGPDDNTVSVLLGSGDGNLQTAVEFPTGSYPFSVTVGDFNDDGGLDLAVANWMDNTVSILLRQPTPPVPIVLSVAGLQFGNMNVGSSSAVQAVTLTNASGTPVTITGISVIGEFSQTNNCGGLLAAGVICTVSVTFTPTVSGARSGSITISYDGVGSPQSIALAGTGVAAELTLSPSTLTFSAELVGTSSEDSSVTATDSSNETLTISSITVSGTDAKDFAIQSGSTCSAGTALAAGKACTVSLVFTPSAAGSRSANLTITDSANNQTSTQTVALSGTGQDFTIGPYLLSATVLPGAGASYPFGVTPLGGFAQPVQLACSGAPAQSNCSMNPTPLTLDGRNQASVVMQVTTTQASRTTPPFDPPGKSFRLRPVTMLGLTLFGFLVLLVLSQTGGKGCKWRRLAPAAVIVALVMVWLACGSNPSVSTPPPSGGTPAGTYTLTVTATSGSLSHSVTVQLIVQ
jgi:large repetitive protein